MPGKHSRNKGARIERQIVALHDEIPVAAEKVSRSGYTGEDLCVADTWKGEVKARANGFKLIERWLEEADILFLRSDGRTYPTVALRWEVYQKLIRAWAGSSSQTPLPPEAATAPRVAP